MTHGRSKGVSIIALSDFVTALPAEIVNLHKASRPWPLKGHQYLKVVIQHNLAR